MYVCMYVCIYNRMMFASNLERHDWGGKLVSIKNIKESHFELRITQFPTAVFDSLSELQT